MAVHVEPQPLGGPLTGGSAGATVAVEPLIAGRVEFPRAAMVDPGGSFKTLRLARAISSSKQAESVPVPAFLIHHPTAGQILVDTGLHPSIASGGSENFGGLANRFGRPSLKPGEDVPSQLRARGIEPRSIAVVIMTHLHLDHSSAISEFPH
jgi:N-acyl homoserine lactone hydrolase